MVSEVIDKLFSFMKCFEKDKELRRVIFGLIAIFRIQDECLPIFIKEKRPVIIEHFMLLTKKRHIERLRCLKAVNKRIEDEGSKQAVLDEEAEDIDEDFQHQLGNVKLYETSMDSFDEIASLKEVLA